MVEDEADIRELIHLHLKRDHFAVDTAATGEEALRLLEHSDYDLAILDWMLPGISGLEICKKLEGRIPVLIVTARAEAADIVLGLEMGADDYVTKPFEIPVLLARVRNILKRFNTQPDTSGTLLKVGELTLSEETHEARLSGNKLELTASEFRLLSALLKNTGRVLARQKLIELIQGEGINVTLRTIDTHVFGLRKKLGDAGSLIETIRGVGYRVQAV
ncbi:MAG TPA: DNA-binding response regulator [Bdellovibrionales bacterium]|nr:DNA-binding response regulator [Bdellovibrionales bacterium]HCM39656.1 DNA-binding response regulator [Bdellovibrionales bacterium]